jgi:hypothetical protein
MKSNIIELLVFTILTIATVVLTYNFYSSYKLPLTMLGNNVENFIVKRKFKMNKNSSPWYADTVIPYSYDQRVDENTLGKTMFHDQPSTI